MNSVLAWHMEADIWKNYRMCMSLGTEIHQI